jgi:hypothetical protein
MDSYWLLDEVKYWTLLFAGPVGDDPLGTEQLAFGRLHSLPELLHREATSCFASITKGYEELLDKIESNLGDRDGILDPDNHGKLLIEDQSFERSRRYFWTIDALDTFGGTLEESLKIFELFTSNIQERIRGNLPWMARQVSEEVTHAQKLLERIKAVKERTKTLRDGVRMPYLLRYQ